MHNTGMRCEKPVRQIRIGFQCPLRHEIDRKFCGICNRHNLVVFPVQNQHRYGQRFEVIGKICFGKRPDAIVMRLCTTYHALTPPVVDHPLLDVSAITIEAVRIGHGLQHDRGHSAKQGGLCDTTIFSAGSVTCDFAATSRMADVNRIL